MKFHYRKLLMAVGLALLLGVTALVITSCGKTTSAAGGRRRHPMSKSRTVEQKDIPIEREWIGTLDGLVNAAIKAAGDRLSAHAELRRRLVRPKGPTAV